MSSNRFRSPASYGPPSSPLGVYPPRRTYAAIASRRDGGGPDPSRWSNFPHETVPLRGVPPDDPAFDDPSPPSEAHLEPLNRSLNRNRPTGSSSISKASRQPPTRDARFHGAPSGSISSSRSVPPYGSRSSSGSGTSTTGIASTRSVPPHGSGSKRTHRRRRMRRSKKRRRGGSGKKKNDGGPQQMEHGNSRQHPRNRQNGSGSGSGSGGFVSPEEQRLQRLGREYRKEDHVVTRVVETMDRVGGSGIGSGSGTEELNRKKPVSVSGVSRRGRGRGTQLVMPEPEKQPEEPRGPVARGWSPSLKDTSDARLLPLKSRAEIAITRFFRQPKGVSAEDLGWIPKVSGDVASFVSRTCFEIYGASEPVVNTFHFGYLGFRIVVPERYLGKIRNALNRESENQNWGLLENATIEGDGLYSEGEGLSGILPVSLEHLIREKGHFRKGDGVVVGDAEDSRRRETKLRSWEVFHFKCVCSNLDSFAFLGSMKKDYCELSSGASIRRVRLFDFLWEFTIHCVPQWLNLRFVLRALRKIVEDEKRACWIGGEQEDGMKPMPDHEIPNAIGLYGPDLERNRDGTIHVRTSSSFLKNALGLLSQSHAGGNRGDSFLPVTLSTEKGLVLPVFLDRLVRKIHVESSHSIQTRLPVLASSLKVRLSGERFLRVRFMQLQNDKFAWPSTSADYIYAMNFLGDQKIVEVFIENCSERARIQQQREIAEIFPDARFPDCVAPARSFMESGSLPSSSSLMADFATDEEEETLPTPEEWTKLKRRMQYLHRCLAHKDSVINLYKNAVAERDKYIDYLLLGGDPDV